MALAVSFDPIGGREDLRKMDQTACKPGSVPPETRRPRT